MDIIERQINLKGDLTPEKVDQLIDIASRCLVHRTLTSETIKCTEVL